MSIQGNKPLRFFSAAILTWIVIAHLLGQVNLFEAWVFWIVLLMSANALQASFTGFCPMFKNAQGECIGCGTTCSSERDKPVAKSGCCDGATQMACCDDSAKGCCSTAALEVKVLGTGCANCDHTAKLIQKTADEMGVAIKMIKVEAVADIASYGVMSTPAVVIGDEVLHSGGIPVKTVVQAWLKKG